MNSGKFLIRPYAEIFLNDMKEFYEIVVFTAATKDYADWILNILDSKKCISYRLYREHTIRNGHNFLKVSKIQKIF